jgi:hypothetical protein
MAPHPTSIAAATTTATMAIFIFAGPHLSIVTQTVTQTQRQGATCPAIIQNMNHCRDAPPTRQMPFYFRKT